MAKFSRQGGALLIGILSSIIAGHVASAQTAALPAGWAHADIGNPLVAGNATSNGGTIAVTGAGADIGGKSDEFHYAYLPVSGDVEIRVRVDSLQNIDPVAKAGLMIRESLTDTARHAFMFVSAGQGVGFVRRTRAGRPSTQTSAAAVAAPVWLRLVRKGNLFTAYSSDTGASWTQLGSDTISMAADVYVGLAVTSHQPSLTATASFTGLAFGAAAPLPAPWVAGEIGSQTPSGAASLASGVFTVTGGGPDIAGTSDQFEFVYQPITGDTQIVAWVANLQAADGWSKAGVMIRGGLTASAPHASLFATGANGWTFQRRLADAGISYSSAGSAGAVPGWVRVVREGNLFSAYQSQDGSQWVLVGTDTIVMPATVFVGLAVTSHTTAATATATFSNVTAGASTTTNKPPTVSISTPTTGATFQSPATIAITATAGDVDGSVARVDFYAGTQLVGSATTSPFTATWSNVPAGSYSLSAVATDNAGDKTTSQTVAVTVNGTTNKAPTVSVTSPSAGPRTPRRPPSPSMPMPPIVMERLRESIFTPPANSWDRRSGKPYRATWTNAAAGWSSLTAVATDNAGATAMSQPVAVTVSGPVNQPPTVVLTAPATGATYTPPATITLTANAADKDGTVARVDFYAGTQLVGSDTSSPYAVTWSSVAIGSYSLTAVATDNTGARTTSQAIAVTVANNKPPTVSLTAPGSGASYMAPVNLILSGAASDPDGTVARVDFYAGTQLVGSDASAPYSVTWNNVPRRHVQPVGGRDRQCRDDRGFPAGQRDRRGQPAANGVDFHADDRGQFHGTGEPCHQRDRRRHRRFDRARRLLRRDAARGIVDDEPLRHHLEQRGGRKLRAHGGGDRQRGPGDDLAGRQRDGGAGFAHSDHARIRAARGLCHRRHVEHRRAPSFGRRYDGSSGCHEEPWNAGGDQRADLRRHLLDRRPATRRLLLCSRRHDRSLEDRRRAVHRHRSTGDPSIDRGQSCDQSIGLAPFGRNYMPSTPAV